MCTHVYGFHRKRVDALNIDGGRSVDGESVQLGTSLFQTGKRNLKDTALLKGGIFTLATMLHKDCLGTLRRDVTVWGVSG